MSWRLITPDFIKTQGILEQNVDEGYISPYIDFCQELYVQDILGTGLYREILAQAEADTLTALNETLLTDYVIPFLLWYVQAECLQGIHWKATNQAVLNKDSNTGSPSSPTEVHALQKSFSYKAEFYAAKCIMYLCENSEDYPLYTNPGTGFDIKRPKKSPYRTGIYFGGTRRYPKGMQIDWGSKE